MALAVRETDLSRHIREQLKEAGVPATFSEDPSEFKPGVCYVTTASVASGFTMKG